MQDMLTSHKFERHSNSVVAGTTDIEPTNGIDISGYDGILFIVSFGVITATAVTVVKAQQSSVLDGTGDAFADLLGTAIAVADDDDNKIVVLDIENPREQFVRCVVVRGTANAVLDGITAIRYHAGSKPTVQTGLAGSERHWNPAPGTA